MKISEVTIKNVLGVRDMKFVPGKITEITGRNGSGKSSVLAAVQAGLKRGNLANLATIGSEEEPETVLVMDDGAFVVKSEGDEKIVKERVGNTAAYEKRRGPQTWLDSLYDAKGSNPVTFLSAHPNERADILLQVLPLELQPDQLRKAVGEGLWPSVQAIAQAGGHPLTILTRAHEALFTERTGINTTRRDKKATTDQLERSIPADLPEATREGLDALEAERDELQKTVTERRAAAESWYRTAISEAEAAFDTLKAREMGNYKAAASKARDAAAQRVRALEAAAEQEIAAIRDRLARATAAEKDGVEVEVDALSAAGTDAIEGAAMVLGEIRRVQAEARTNRLDSLAEPERRMATVSEQIATIRANADRVAEIRNTREMVERFKSEVESLDGKAEALTAGLESLAVLKSQLLAALPIEGLEVVGKEIRVNKVPYDSLNTAQRIRLAVQVAALRAKSQTLPCIFIDGAEAFDAEQYAVLVDELKKTGAQVFISKVTSGDLKVTAVA